MPPPTYGMARWNDDRLDDFARTVNDRFTSHSEHLRRLDETVVAVAVFAERLNEVQSDTSQCVLSLEGLRRSLESRDAEQQRERIEQRRERKLDRRWMIGTMIAVAAIIVTALGIFIG